MQVAVGNKSGEIMVYDIASSSLESTIKAHDGAVWAMHVRPDGQALVTGSADKTVKFWDIKRTVDRETRVCTCQSKSRTN